MCNKSKLRALFLGCVVGVAVSLSAQNNSSTPSSGAAADSGYPEQAYLSASRYVNQYFGFSFELPPEAHLHPAPEPAARDASIPLLDLAGPPPADAQVLIAAIPMASGRNDDAKVLLRQALDRELYIGVEEIRGLSKASLSGHQFFLFETRRGIEQHMLLATTVGDYILRVVVAAHDEKTLKQLEVSFEHVVFFAPTALRQYLEADAKSYDGPSISSHRLALLERDPPAKRIYAGNIEGDFYENSMLGFSYRIPQGWSIESNGIVQSAVERYRAQQDMGQPSMGRVERRLVEDCSRTLFSVWAKRPGADGQISYDDFGEVTVSAMAAACFPNMKFPQNATDREGFKAFLAEYALTHPIVGDMRDAKVFTEDGVTMLFLEGTVAFQVADDELSRRLSLGVAITQRRGYVVTWFFAAPHDEELRALANERAIFDPEAPAKLASAPQPGGGLPAESPRTTPATAAIGSSSASTPAHTAAASPKVGSSAVASASEAAPASADGSDQYTKEQTSFHPSLLRPGETMESQQEKGAPLKKQ